MALTDVLHGSTANNFSLFKKSGGRIPHRTCLKPYAANMFLHRMRGGGALQVTTADRRQKSRRACAFSAVGSFFRRHFLPFRSPRRLGATREKPTTWDFAENTSGQSNQSDCLFDLSCIRFHQPVAKCEVDLAKCINTLISIIWIGIRLLTQLTLLGQNRHANWKHHAIQPSAKDRRPREGRRRSLKSRIDNDAFRMGRIRVC